jgi:hypothetical protein
MVMEFIAYIDEAGDEGLTKLRDETSRQSRWLMLGGIIVSADRDRLHCKSPRLPLGTAH